MPHHDHHHDHHHGHHDKHDKSNDPWDKYWWKDLKDDQKEAATALGWDQNMWDTNGGPPDTEAMGFHDLSHEQRKAAELFGYHPKLWDHGDGHHHLPEGHNWDPHPGEDTSGGVPDVSKLNVNDDKKDDSSGDKKDDSAAKDEKKKPNFKTSESYGGPGGEKFDHGNNRHISGITIYSDSHVVNGLEIKYANGSKKVGNCDKSLTNKESEFNIHADKGECITSVTVRANKYVQSIGFKTNKGRMFGPHGGKGWNKLTGALSGKDDPEGEEIKVPAPMKLQLCGLLGRGGDRIDQIAFRWGPIP